VMGVPNYGNYQAENSVRVYDQNYIWSFGYVNAGDSDAIGNDPTVLATLLRHGNYDYATASTIWATAIADHSIPASYYLAGKPSWWDNSPWPPIGPDLTPMVGTIPAENRFNALLSGTSRPGPASNLRIAGQ